MPAHALLLGALLIQSGAPFMKDPLWGFGPTSVVVEHLSEAVASCNVRGDALELAASRPLLDGHIRIDPNASSVIYVDANLTLVGQTCVATIDVSAQTSALSVLPYGAGDPVRVTVMLWNRGTILTGPAADFGERANAYVRGAVEQFVTKLKLVNQR